MSTEMPELLDEVQLDLFTDVFQFSVADGRGFTCDPSPEWVSSLMPPRMIAVTRGVIAVGTVRNMSAPVHVQRWDRDPSDSLDDFDQVAEAAIEVVSGVLVIMGPSDLPRDAVRLSVPRGTYRARIYYSGLDDLSEDELDGNDTYRIALWPGAYRPARIVKQHQDETP